MIVKRHRKPNSLFDKCGIDIIQDLVDTIVSSHKTYTSTVYVSLIKIKKSLYK